MDEQKLIVVSLPEPRIRLLTINRPKKRNALSQSLIKELVHALAATNSDPDIHVAVLTGAESLFSGKRFS
jgi:enoyl-CoA hydratase/carnithine racemase